VTATAGTANISRQALVLQILSFYFNLQVGIFGLVTLKYFKVANCTKVVDLHNRIFVLSAQIFLYRKIISETLFEKANKYA